MLQWYTHDISTLVLMALLLLACVFDLRQHRVPNKLVLAGVVIAIAIHGYFLGVRGIHSSIVGLMIGGGLLLPFYLLKIQRQRLMGAGDVKLMATVGAFLGFPNALLATGLTLGVGSVAGLIYLLGRGALVEAAQRYWLTLKTLAFTRQWVYQAPENGNPALHRFPYSLAVAAGTLIALGHLSLLNFVHLRKLLEGALL